MSRSYTISIDEELCKGSLCHICINICPKTVLSASQTPSKFGGVIPMVMAADQCIGCRQCELHCPDLCISVERVQS